MSSVRSASPIDHGSTSSRFSFRDLRQLQRSSTKSPLRVITLIDFDCFYAQCETVRLGLSPDHPLGVQQFNHVIAMNYAARARGLKKVESAEEAKRLCPELVLQHVPTWREGDTTWRYRDDSLEHMDIEKSSLDFYRLKSRQAMDVLKRTLSPLVQRIERAGIDETYVDLSAQVHAILVERYPELSISSDTLDDHLMPRPKAVSASWHDSIVEAVDSDDDTGTAMERREEDGDFDWNDVALQIGCEIVSNVRRTVLDELQYTCSAGIAHTKVVAKLAAGHNKPNKQTVVREVAVSSFLMPYKYTKMRGLGGKLGQEIAQKLGHETIADVRHLSRSGMQTKLGASTGTWFYDMIRGREDSEVVSRTQVKSVCSAKTFMQSITGMEQAEKWLYIFAADIVGRLDDIGPRRPKTISTNVQINGPRKPARSKQAPIPSTAPVDVDCLLNLSRQLLLELSRDGPTWPLVTLSVTVSDLQDLDTSNRSLKLMLLDQKAGNVQANAWSSNETVYASSVQATPRKRTLHDFRGFGAHDESGRDQEAKRARSSEVAHAEPQSPSIEAISSTPNDLYSCPICSQRIAEVDVLEHLDWHAALDLQKNDA